MDNNNQAMVVGLGAGLGGFVGFVIIACICWNILCGTWCDKKPTPPPPIIQSTIRQHRHRTSNGLPNRFPDKNQTTVIAMSNNMKANNKRIHPESHISSLDLANQIKSIRR